MNQDLAKLLQMPLQEDVRQQAALEILEGKPLEVALRHARAEVARQMRPSGFTSFDEEKEGEVPLRERIASTDQEEKPRHALEQAKAGVEAVAEMFCRGTKALAAERGITQRRAQQIFKEILRRAEEGDDLFLGGAA